MSIMHTFCNSDRRSSVVDDSLGLWSNGQGPVPLLRVVRTTSSLERKSCFRPSTMNWSHVLNWNYVLVLDRLRSKSIKPTRADVHTWRTDVVSSNQCYGRFRGAATIASMTEKRRSCRTLIAQ
ncbi:hypothetical protein pRL120501 [Rhizobium johnstonii 3841]|uniref:Uncharacterized protein n=1 Tax=Rhizobium johnstonii (strain DSM 114642 / LMG 32736 / 3841) TaxID=216596 RepID=Q1M3W4_RHIJ3|nr:hypothetical protein pRL120501 [Rhizobium johnstonii 3841]